MSDLTRVGPLDGYLAKPSGGVPSPGLIVIQEWWGLDAQTKSIADRFSGLGYLAFAPDLYHGELAAPGDSQAASALLEKHGPGAPDELAAVFDALSLHPLCDGRVGSIGFCFGGRMSLALGVRRPVRAVCTFYGGQMQLLFDQLHRLKAPVLALFGDRDQSIPPGTIREFELLLDRFGLDHEIVVYPDSGHAFFRDTDPRVFKPEAARDAWQRTTRFFNRHIPTGPLEPPA
jgi:carboxymethylenebutenolidase